MTEQSYKGFIIGMFVGDILARQQMNNTIRLSNDVKDAFRCLPEVTDYNAELEKNPLLALLVGTKYTIEKFPKVESSVSYACMQLPQLVQAKIDPIKYMEKIWANCSGHDPLFDLTVRKIGHVLGFGSATHAMRLIKTSSKEATLFTTALYCIMRHPDDFTSAIRCASQAPYQPHIVVSITGAIIGLRNEVDSISLKWRNLITRTIDVQFYLDSLNTQK